MKTERPPHPGVMLKERFLDPLGIAPADLASYLKVSIRRVHSLVRGRSGITTDMAIRLGLFFRVPPAWWLDLQAQYDTVGAPLVEELRDQVRPWVNLEHVLVGPRGVRILQPSPKREPGPILVPVPLNSCRDCGRRRRWGNRTARGRFGWSPTKTGQSPWSGLTSESA